MENNKNKINSLSSQYALTNSQLLDYLLMHNIKILNENEDIDITNQKIKKILNELTPIQNNHKNKTKLRSIEIEGLFGKYNYKLDFKNDISILISENGIGKTTILNIIVAILTGDVRTLYNINFEKISVNISNKIYVIDKRKSNKLQDDKDISKYLTRRLLFMLEDLERHIPRPLYLKLRMEAERTGYIDSAVLDELIRILSLKESFNNTGLELLIHEIKDLKYRELSNEIYKIKEKLLDKEIIFYPTYRRVEVGIEQVFSSESRKYKNRELTTKYMGFGMSDVKKRIKNLLEKLREDANKAYIDMNAKIISELLENNIDSYTEDDKDINMHKVDVVIKRIGEDRIDNINKLKSFVNADVKPEENVRNYSNAKFLIYYLKKLVNIYNSQEGIDKKLSEFARVCSKYLTGKKIVYDETMLTMNVFDDDGIGIDIDDLSSGEKQVISIFSKVYLDVTSPCIFIIDEPEISLSIEWQKEFLKDIYESKKIALLIATTHSPFIFKNEYIDYVEELKLHKENNDDIKR